MGPGIFYTVGVAIQLMGNVQYMIRNQVLQPYMAGLDKESEATHKHTLHLLAKESQGSPHQELWALQPKKALGKIRKGAS